MEIKINDLKSNGQGIVFLCRNSEGEQMLTVITLEHATVEQKTALVNALWELGPKEILVQERLG